MATKGLIDQPPCEGDECSKPQAPEDRQAPGYSNDVPIDSWLRGGGKGQATSKPGFDKGNK